MGGEDSSTFFFSRLRESLEDPELPPFNWDSLIREGLVEFIDTEEEDTCMIAMFVNDLKLVIFGSTLETSGEVRNTLETSGEVGTTLETSVIFSSSSNYCRTYTHCEIHPSLILGMMDTLVSSAVSHLLQSFRV